jgi:hypothetical protein
MQYRLRTLHLLLVIGPLLLALLYWTIQWRLGQRAHPTLVVFIVVGYLMASILGPILCYRELLEMLCGPDLRNVKRRKSRQKVRVRIERRVWEST